MSWQQSLIGLCIAFLALCIVSLATRPVKRNRRHNLPPPDDRCKRAPDWRVYELKTPRNYLP